eukprot:1391771-Alexandrium_andersonii.AAC.1
MQGPSKHLECARSMKLGTQTPPPSLIPAKAQMLQNCRAPGCKDARSNVRGRCEGKIRGLRS